MRYWLNVPKYKHQQAMQAGCRYDSSRSLWYVDEPFLSGFRLSDFMAWNPVCHDEVAHRSHVQAEHAKKIRAQEEAWLKRKKKSGSSPRQRGIIGVGHRPTLPHSS